MSAERIDDPHRSLPSLPLGPYRLLAPLGAECPGAVYLAEKAPQEAGSPPQRVAIRILSSAPLGFEALTRLKHPNIAAALDTGQTLDGFPYLVTEYVDGIPIDRYAAEKRLNLVARLTLFRNACAAVSYAHSNHVMHGGLNPRNILVTANGVAKLLDFGIASRMTPGYASPEQTAGRALTAASDIYSLGAILYELLTGAPPDPQSRVPPGVLLRSGSSPAGAPPDGRRRTTSDLDNVVLKALRREPQRRYDSVADFSEDVQLFLEDYPVKARPDSLAYRLTRFLRR